MDNETEPVYHEILENCQLEWDKRRGVLYIHNKETGATVIRINGIPPTTMMLTPGNLLDITSGREIRIPR